MKIEIPNDIIEAAGLTEEELKSALAVHLFLQGGLNREDASQLGGCSQDKLLEMAAETRTAAGTAGFDMNEFLSWASHDLKTPMNSVIGFSRIILKGIDGPVTDLQITDLTMMNNSGQRMLALISQLVEMARLNRGETRAKREQVEIMPLIETSVESWKQKNPGRELQTNFVIPSHPPTFNVDAQQVRQVVTNLLTYAGLHVAEGGQVNISVDGTAKGLTLNINSTGTRTSADVKLDAAMLSFISKALLALNEAELELCQADENGAQIRFTFIKT
jgi:signal transduction histidine kinase